MFHKPFFLDDTIENNIIFNRFKNNNTKKYQLGFKNFSTRQIYKRTSQKTKTNLEMMRLKFQEVKNKESF